MGMLTRDALLSSDDLMEEEVKVAAWNGSVKIRELTKEQQDRIRANAADKKTGWLDDTMIEVGTFIEGVVEPRFTFEDAVKLKRKSADAIDLVVGRIVALSGQRKEDVDAEVSAFPSEPDADVPVRVGGEAGVDGGQSESGPATAVVGQGVHPVAGV